MPVRAETLELKQAIKLKKGAFWAWLAGGRGGGFPAGLEVQANYQMALEREAKADDSVSAEPSELTANVVWRCSQVMEGALKALLNLTDTPSWQEAGFEDLGKNCSYL